MQSLHIEYWLDPLRCSWVWLPDWLNLLCAARRGCCLEERFWDAAETRQLEEPRALSAAASAVRVGMVVRGCYLCWSSLQKVWSGASPSHPEKHPCGQAPLESNPNVSMQTRSQGLHVDVQQAQQPNVTLNVEDDGMSTSWLRWIKSEAFILWGQWISVQNAPDQLSSN